MVGVMRFAAVLALVVMVFVHHGVPGMGHVGHGAVTTPCASQECAGGVPAPHDDAAAIAAACLAILALVATARRGPLRRLWRCVPVGMHSRRATAHAWLRPPPHAPPRPIRPCVLQR